MSWSSSQEVSATEAQGWLSTDFLATATIDQLDKVFLIPHHLCHCHFLHVLDWHNCSYVLSLSPGTGGTVHPWKQALLARSLGPNWKFHWCGEVSRCRYFLLLIIFFPPGMFPGGWNVTQRATLTGLAILSQEINISCWSFRIIQNNHLNIDDHLLTIYGRDSTWYSQHRRVD